MSAIANLRMAFPRASVEQLNDALLRAGGDVNRASEMLLRGPQGPEGRTSHGGSSPSSAVPARAHPPDLRRDPEGWFRFFDRDGNGLQQNEVAEAVAQTFRTLPAGAARELVRGLWPLFDMDRSGSISMREFTKREGLRDALLAQLGAEVGGSGSPGGYRPGVYPSQPPATPVVQGILLDDPPGPVPASKGKGGRTPAGKGGGGKDGKDGRHSKGGKDGKAGAADHGGKGGKAPGAKGGGKGGKAGTWTAGELSKAPGAKGDGKGDGKAGKDGKAGAGAHRPAVAGHAALPSFEEVLAALRPLHRRLGGTPHFGRRDPAIPKKLTGSQLEKSSDYEYVFLTVLGFQALQTHGAEIIRLNNGAHFKHNPGTMRLEEVSGFTMHGDRPGANGILRTAAEAMLRAFDVARRKGLVTEFFSGEAFDRTADPCLEGRLGRILGFLEAHGADDAAGGGGGPPAADLCAETMPDGAPVERVVGEHLRVYRNKCIHHWAQANGLPYERAKALWTAAEAGSPEAGAPKPDVRRLCNDAGLLRYLEAAGLVSGRPSAGARAYPIDELRRAVAFFVEMETLSAA